MKQGRVGHVGQVGRVGLVGLALMLIASPGFAATKAIRAGKAIDPSGNVITNAVIVVENDRIISVGTAAPPAGAEVVDLRRFTVIPGMIDMHVQAGGSGLPAVARISQDARAKAGGSGGFGSQV